MLYGKTTRTLVVGAMISLLIAIVLPAAASAQGRGRGRWDNDRNERRYERRGRHDKRKSEKFINGHDARDGKWDRRRDNNWDRRWERRDSGYNYQYNPRNNYRYRNNYQYRNRYRNGNQYYLNQNRNDGYNYYNQATPYNYGSGSILSNILTGLLGYQ